MADMISDVLPPSLRIVDASNDAVLDRLDALISAYGAEAMAAGTDRVRFDRAVKYRGHLMDLRTRWIDGEASPVRTGKAKQAP